jgi:hypothetical protein
MDTAGGFGRGVAANAAGERKLLEEALHPCHIFTLVRVNLGICSLEIGLGQDRRRTVTRPGDENGIEIILVDQPVEVDIREGLAGIRTPVAEQAGLDVL